MKKSIPTCVAHGRSFALEAAGFDVWRKQARLETHTGAADWLRPRRAEEIAFTLADCGVVCLMWSQHAAASKWVAPDGSSTNDPLANQVYHVF